MILSKTEIHGPKPVGPGPSGSVLVLGPDQDRKHLRNLGPNRTRTQKISEIPSKIGPGPGKFQNSRINSDQNGRSLVLIVGFEFYECQNKQSWKWITGHSCSAFISRISIQIVHITNQKFHLKYLLNYLTTLQIKYRFSGLFENLKLLGKLPWIEMYFRSNYENNLDRNIDRRKRSKFSRH